MLRSQSPGNTHYSPTRYAPKHSTSDRRAEERSVERETKQQMTEKKSTDNNVMHPASRPEANVEMSKFGSCKGHVFEKHTKAHTSELNKSQSPDRKTPVPPKTDFTEKKVNAQNGDPKQGTTDKELVFYSI